MGVLRDMEGKSQSAAVDPVSLSKILTRSATAVCVRGIKYGRI